MKITYLKLKNFATIYTAMKRKEIEIDFSKMKNRIVLLVGDNGSGKTSILSQLHPYALPGSMDVRSGTDLILSGTDGFKEIHITNDDDQYTIKHFYQYATGKGMKSYISKNGSEMNPNGNVSSFHEIIETELALEPDYLKLLRLGTNVAGFMKMKSAERKKFMTDLMSEIDTYTKYYRKINDDTRLMKQLLKTTADKLARLHIHDEKEEYEKVEALKSNVKSLYETNDRLQHQSGSLTSKLESYSVNGMTLDEMKIRSYSLKDLIRSNSKFLEKHEDFIDSISKEELTLELALLEKNLNKANVSIASLETKRDMHITRLDDLYKEKESLESKMRFHTSEEEYSQTVSLFIKLTNEYEKLKTKYSGFSLKATKDDFLLALTTLQEIDLIVRDLHEFDYSAIREVKSLISNGESVNNFVKKRVTKIDAEMSRLQTRNDVQSKNYVPSDDKIYIFMKDEDCKCKTCPFEEFYNDMTKDPSSVDSSETNTSVRSLEIQREYYLSFIDIERKIEFINLMLKSNKALFIKLPQDLVNPFTMDEAIWNNGTIYDEELFTVYISKVEEYEHFTQLKQRVRDVENDKLNMESTKGSIDKLQEVLYSVDNSIFSIEKELTDVKGSLNIESMNKDTIETSIVDVKNNITLLEEIELVQANLNSEVTEMNLINSSLSDAKSIEDELAVSLTNLVKVRKEITTMNELIRDLEFKLKDFKDLSSEQKQLSEQFDDLNIIKEALSSNKGIPLLFIQLYLKNTRSKINELLDVVYKGELEIGEFLINDKDFKIPYIRNGIEIEDVSKCSQGEESFVSLALSFALIEQSIKDYNILLLDEIDATLDTSKRGVFISILEKQLNSISAEQVFVITHNNMFDSYPVDVVLTSDKDIDNLKNTNIIWSAV